MEEQKYYFISFMLNRDLDSKIVNSAVDEHPMDWQMWVEKKYPGRYVLISWNEIDKTRYESFAK